MARFSKFPETFRARKAIFRFIFSSFRDFRETGLRGPFLESPEMFSHPESRSKILNLMITELFYSHIFNMNRGSLHTRGFRRIHFSVFRYRWTKLKWLYGPEKPFVNLPTACSGKPILQHVLKITKSKLTVKFDDLSSLRSWDTEGIVTPENSP